MILGIDEVGRGPWAGPLVVGAVVLGSADISGLTDSKKLSKKRRDEFDALIRERAAGIGLGWVSPLEIDTIGLSAALKLATKRAVEQIRAPYHEIIIDGIVNFLQDTSKGQYVTTMKKADLLVPAVSAASIIAKVARDNYMIEQGLQYPGYGFENHVGYGTAAHIKAIDELGITPLHRLSIAPLLKYAQTHTTPQKPNYRGLSIAAKTTKMIGDEAEEAATDFLQKQGHTMLERNWKTKLCEIDIISQMNNIIYFTEVKYRRTNQQGGGISAVTTKKMRQMHFAADMYVLKNKVTNQNLQLLVIAVTGSPPQIEEVLEVF
jgi:ribonuclease HII